MSKFLLFGIGLLLITATNAQKRSSLFLEGGGYSFSIIDSRPGLPTYHFTKPTASIIYSYAPKDKLAVGLGIEAGVIPRNFNGTVQNKITVAPILDIKYFLKSNKNIFFPLVQAGYNLYHDHSIFNMPQESFQTGFSSRGQFAIGFGYSRSVLKSGGGPFIQLKLEDQIYNGKVKSITEPSKATSSSNTSLVGVAATIGFRF